MQCSSRLHVAQRRRADPRHVRRFRRRGVPSPWRLLGVHRVADLERPERLECHENRGRRRDQIRDEALIDVQKPFVLALIPNLVALVEYPPNVWTESERER